MADKKVRTYSPEDIIFNFGGIDINGFVEGTFIEVTKDPLFTKVGGIHQVSRVKRGNRDATITLTLQQTSVSNDVLNAFVLADDATSSGILPLTIKDVNGTTLLFSEQSWLQDYPDITFSDTVEGRSWLFDVASLDVLVGGSDSST